MVEVYLLDLLFESSDLLRQSILYIEVDLGPGLVAAANDHRSELFISHHVFDGGVQ